MTHEELLPMQRVTAVTGVSRATIYRLIAEGAFPPPIHVRGRSLWPMSRIQAWIARTVAEQSPDSHQPNGEAEKLAA